LPFSACVPEGLGYERASDPWATSQPPWNFVAAFFFIFRPFSRCWMLLE
jgi:hypothetical protein